ncbi:MAG: hypothetical protein IJA02_02685 [Clostridia bacterium]|nr:hypothetical protein [Clostridia bacterium]MBQ6873559.1 hypothetical protein [Clostridia bacterium]
MKKIISICLVLLSISSMMSINAFAVDLVGEDILVIEDDIIEEVYGLYNTNNSSNISLMSTGLIVSKSLKLSKTSNGLIITATTVGNADVKKCGFTYIKLQRLINGTWTDYTTYCYYDQYSESTSKTFSKTITAPTGYTYRVICEHYAEKTKLLIFKETETSYNVTSSLAF